VYPDFDVHLTDSGTSALLLALEFAFTTLREGPGTPTLVAVPAYACPDIATAVIGARGRMVLYDTDPATLMPDWESVRGAMKAGARVVVVAHLFGRVIDLAPAAALAAEFGALVVEDAAQHAGGTIHGVRGGAQGTLGVLSFGRGKGLNAGGGGALLSRRGTLQRVPESTMSLGLRQLVQAALSDVLSHPLLFSIPASIPAFGVGATTYREPQAPGGIPATVAALLIEAIRCEPSALRQRRERERRMLDALDQSSRPEFQLPSRCEGSGALRTPVLLAPAFVASHPHCRALGIARSYPRTLADYRAVGDALHPSSSRLTGAALLAERTYTLPTHRHVGDEEFARIVALLTRPA